MGYGSIHDGEQFGIIVEGCSSKGLEHQFIVSLSGGDLSSMFWEEYRVTDVHKIQTEFR